MTKIVYYYKRDINNIQIKDNYVLTNHYLQPIHLLACANYFFKSSHFFLYQLIEYNFKYIVPGGFLDSTPEGILINHYHFNSIREGNKPNDILYLSYKQALTYIQKHHSKFIFLLSLSKIYTNSFFLSEIYNVYNFSYICDNLFFNNLQEFILFTNNHQITLPDFFYLNYSGTISEVFHQLMKYFNYFINLYEFLDEHWVCFPIYDKEFNYIYSYKSIILKEKINYSIEIKSIYTNKNHLYEHYLQNLGYKIHTKNLIKEEYKLFINNCKNFIKFMCPSNQIIIFNHMQKRTLEQRINEPIEVFSYYEKKNILVMNNKSTPQIQEFIL